MPIPSVQTQQLPDGSQLRTTVNPDGSIYYDNLTGGAITATSAWDINGNNLFTSEVQSTSPAILSAGGVSTGVVPQRVAFFDTVDSLQASLTSDPTATLPTVSQPVTLNEVNTEVPNGLTGGLVLSGTDANVLNTLTTPNPSNVILAPATLINGAGRATAVSVLPGGGLGPGHINTGLRFGLRHFTFVLNDGVVTNNVYSLDLNINPEDMTIETPYKVGSYNTMAGAFIDVWGQGIRRIVLRGHTGWKTQATTTQTQDGFDNFFALHEDIIQRYFTFREQASNDWTQDKLENSLTLQIVDRLHNKSYYVVPEQFRLLRNRARPLLHMYEVSFVVVDININSFADLSPLDKEDKTKQLWGGFGESQSFFNQLAAQAKGVGGPFGKVLTDLNNTGGGISATFKGLLTAKQDITKGVAGIQQLFATAAHGVTRAIGTLQSFTDLSPIAADVKLMIGDTKKAFNELACLIDQVEHVGLLTYTGIIGSCACCRAIFGTNKSPLQTTSNTFATLKAGGDEAQLLQAANAVSPQAQTIANKINNLDVPMLLRGNR